MHAIGRDSEGRPCLADDVASAVVKLCVDRRGVWLQLREGAKGLHVNGRPVRRMAMLRKGDAIYLDGVELVLLGASPRALPADADERRQEDPRMVLRGVGGLHHGRSFTLRIGRLVGRAPECDIRIDEPAFASLHARLDPHAEGVVLRDIGSPGGFVVNGERVREALLVPGDQVVFDAHHRFVVEAPMSTTGGRMAPMEAPEEFASADQRADGVTQFPASARRVPWLLLAALLLSGALSLLLMYGTR